MSPLANAMKSESLASQKATGGSEVDHHITGTWYANNYQNYGTSHSYEDAYYDALDELATGDDENAPYLIKGNNGRYVFA